MTERPRLTFFLDVDNTLLDNDAAKTEMDRRLRHLVGDQGAARFWRIYEDIRGETTIVDIPSTIARWCSGQDDREVRFGLADLFMAFDFVDFVYPDAIAALKHLQTFGTTAILSDGDPVFQNAKIHRSGLAGAVGGNVIVYPHKDKHLIEITAAFPADRYVFVDDKPSVLAKIADGMTAPFSTIFIRQGKYAREPLGAFTPTRSIASLSDLFGLTSWSD